MIAVKDIAYVRFTAPDLDDMEKFLVDFGLHRNMRTDTALYMRGAGTAPFIHVTERGNPPGRQGVGFWAQSLADLEELATENGCAVEDNPEPGGGKLVRLRDPDGTYVEVVYGQTPLAHLPTPLPLETNFADKRKRLNSTSAYNPRPAWVKRFGHLVMRVKNCQASIKWYQEKLGMKISDSYFMGEENNIVMGFLRCGLGATYTDHHTIALIQHPNTGHDHAAFEVLDFDDLMVGNEHLTRAGHAHAWGVGRHILGSQVFDYWYDPVGMKVEHWTDGDAINDDYPSKNIPMAGPSTDGISVWGPPPSPKFFS